MYALSNWLARQTVNLVPRGHVGSSPTAYTKRLREGRWFKSTHLNKMMPDRRIGKVTGL